MEQNSNKLYYLVSRCQKNENAGFIELISMFQPLLRKYVFLLNYSDAYMDLYDCFIDCIYKIPLQQLKVSENDSVVLAYIKTSIRNAYISLSRKKFTKYSDFTGRLRVPKRPARLSSNGF